MSIFLSNFARTVTTQGIDENATSVSVSDLGSFPASDWVNGGYSYVVLQGSANRNDVEVIKVTAAAGNTVTFERGQEGTTPRAFPSGSLFELRLTGQSLYDFIRQSCNNDSMQLSRAHNMNRFPANGFVDYGQAYSGGSGSPINEGLWTYETTANRLFAGRIDPTSVGTSRTQFPSTFVAGFITKFFNLSDSGNSNQIKLPSQPVDGSIIADSSGDARGTGQYNLDLLNEVDPKYGNTALAAGDSAQSRAFEGNTRNGDFRDGATHWDSSNGATIAANNGILTMTQVSFGNGQVTNAGVSPVSGESYVAEIVVTATTAVNLRTLLGDADVALSVGVNVVPFTFTSGQYIIPVRHIGGSAGEATSVTSVSIRAATEEVVTTPVDMYGAEHWLEAITPEKPQCYPYGLPQQLGVDVDGIPTRAGTRPATYCSWFDGDLDSVGNEWDFFSLSVLEQDAILNNPDHNVFYSKGQYVQWRARGRSFRGAGNGDWLSVDPLVDGLKYSQQVTIVPQGAKDVAPNPETTDKYIAYPYQGDATFVDEAFLGVYAARNTEVGVAVDGLCFFHVWGQVSRLNAGAYHPSYNSLGTGGFGDTTDGSLINNGAYWHESFSAAPQLKPRSQADCFNVVAYGSSATRAGVYVLQNGSKSGSISSGYSTHPDGFYYDAVYPSGQGGVLDDRLPARDMSSSEEAMKVDLKAKNGSYRGKQKLPFTEIAAQEGATNGSASDFFVSKSAVRAAPEVGSKISQVSGTTVVTRHVLSVSDTGTLWQAFVDEPYSRVAGAHVLSQSGLDVSVEGNLDNGFTVSDVLGDPVNLLSTPDLSSGWVGYWNPNIPAGQSDPVELVRKAVSSTFENTYTLNNGATWSSHSVNITPSTNSSSGGTIPVGYVSIWTYRAVPYVVEDSVNHAVFNAEAGLGGVFFGCGANTSYGGLFNEALLHKVTTSNAGGSSGELGRPLSYLLDKVSGALSSGSLYSPSHNPVWQGAPNNNSPAVKALVYQTSKTQRLGLNYAFNEMKWSGPSYSTITMATTANHSKGTIVFISDGLYQGLYVTEVASFGGSSFQSYADSGSMYLGEGGSIYGASGELAYRKTSKLSWFDDGTIRIGDGIGTYNNLAGVSCLYGTKSLTKPYGYSGNYARAGEQVAGVDL